MKKFMILASLVAFIAVVSCNTNPPAPPSNYEDKMIEVFDYWPYTVGDSFAYVNEIGDSIILNVVTDSISFFYTPTYDPERDSDESGPCVSYDYVDYSFVCVSPRNYLNRDDLRFAMSIVFLNGMYGNIAGKCKTSHPVRDLLGDFYMENNDTIMLNNQQNFDSFYADSIRMLRFRKELPTPEECGDLIRGKGIVRWTDLDGHEWELVDLMNK